MANQLKIRINVEDGIAVVSGLTVAEKGETTIQNDAASGATAQSRVLAVAAAAGSQFLAVTAVAQPVGEFEDPNPIFYPELVYGITAGAVVGVVVGCVVGVVVANQGRKKKKDE